MTVVAEIASYMRENLTHNPLFLVGFLLLLGYSFGKLALLFKLPEISGYIISGMLVNSFTTGVVSHEMNRSLHVITELAVGLVALSIGSEISLRKIRTMGWNIFVVTAFQFVVTFSLVTLALRVFRLPLPYAMLLAVTACATAPALIVAEVHHLRAYGKFVDYLFGTVVAIDAMCVIIFGITFNLVTNYLDVSAGNTMAAFDSIWEIALSVVLGLAGGIAIHALTIRRKNENEIIIVTLGVIFITTGMALVYHLSPLIMNIVTGSVIANLSVRNHRLFVLFERFTPPIYGLFFVIAGIEINPGVFLNLSIMALALVYLSSRFAGKYAGTWAGCKAVGAEPEIRDNLGLCMLSQSGVALGFVLLVQTSPVVSRLGENTDHRIMFTNMMNIVLVSIFFNELVGPVITRFAIMRGNKMIE